MSLRELPAMTETDLMEHFDVIVTDERVLLERVNAHLDAVETNGHLLNRYTALTSGGSSAERGVFLRLGRVDPVLSELLPASPARQAVGTAAIRELLPIPDSPRSTRNCADPRETSCSSSSNA
jgi:hypothetical protein